MTVKRRKVLVQLLSCVCELFLNQCLCISHVDWLGFFFLFGFGFLVLTFGCVFRAQENMCLYKSFRVIGFDVLFFSFPPPKRFVVI